MREENERCGSLWLSLKQLIVSGQPDKVFLVFLLLHRDDLADFSNTSIFTLGALEGIESKVAEPPVWT